MEWSEIQRNTKKYKEIQRNTRKQKGVGVVTELSTQSVNVYVVCITVYR